MCVCYDTGRLLHLLRVLFSCALKGHDVKDLVGQQSASKLRHSNDCNCHVHATILQYAEILATVSHTSNLEVLKVVSHPITLCTCRI